MLAEQSQPIASALNIVPHQTLNRLLATRQYGQLAKLLQHAYTLAHQSGDSAILDTILLAAFQMSQACDTLSETSEWHRWAAEEAKRQEHDLRQLLQIMAGMMHADNQHTTYERPNAQLAATALQAALNRKNAGAHTTNPGVRQRIQNILSGLETLFQPEPSPQQRALAKVAAQTESVSIHAPPGNGVEEPPQRQAAAPPSADMESLVPAQGASPAAPAIIVLNAKSEHTIVVYGLGSFQVYQDDQLVRNWPNRKSKSLFKYLVWNRRPIAKEVIMELFWPDTPADAARNNLNVAIYNLRQTFRQTDTALSYIVFNEDSYQINPDLSLWSDTEAFTACFEKGRKLAKNGHAALAVQEFRAAESLYEGELFEEDRYEDWILPHRQLLQGHYIEILDYLAHHALAEADYSACTALCSKQLLVDPCREDAHRSLMRCYIAQGQYHLAMRQYHRCVETLKEQLDVVPSPETAALYAQIRASL